VTAEDVRRRIVELGPWFQPFTLDGWNTWEVAPHPVYKPDPERARRRWERIASALPESVDGWRILDVGCLEGFMATRLAGLGAHVEAVDTWSGAIEKAKLVAEVLGSGVEARVADIYDVEGEYDLVLMSNVLPVLRDPPMALRHASTLSSRLLVWCRLETPPEGGPGTAWTPSRKELEEALRQGGFSTLHPGDPGDPRSAIYLAERF
jgi:tRNA (mo5U34)-methyltransferase